MELLLICPHCQSKAPLTAKACKECGADLQDLPPASRRYFVIIPKAEMAHEAISEPGEMKPVEPYPENMVLNRDLAATQDVSLCEALDRILNKGAVLFGEVMISVADIDLIYLGLQVVLTSVETARGCNLGLAKSVRSAGRGCQSNSVLD
jgi:hypothetical protein